MSLINIEDVDADMVLMSSLIDEAVNVDVVAIVAADLAVTWMMMQHHMLMWQLGGADMAKYVDVTDDVDANVVKFVGMEVDDVLAIGGVDVYDNDDIARDEGFRKIDPDRWEFANEEFLGGQKHLLKNIKRRRNIGGQSSSQSLMPQQQVSEACIEVERSGVETEVERLRRDRNALMLEVLKLKQQQQNSRAQIVAMEERIHGTEKKQQQTMAFLARALNNPMFIQQLVIRNEQRMMKQVGSPGKKRRLPRNPVDFEQKLLEVEQLLMETDMEALFATLENVEEESGGSNRQSDALMEELLNDSFLGEQPGIIGEPEELAEDVEDLVEQMGFLDSKP
ncbi:hypothetical protein J5N97_012944 [Dioscorea zingiberensis]|uniref:Uncharacterized protein n=1 Tax=Dioscorea zingiberensis TaxID=325984 RepID=A0A9D5CSG6_9LILI|nr:hypothetical protein J5N97_012944 [Dioscorea zingiberensis]